jgi:serine/threonine protein kinase
MQQPPEKIDKYQILSVLGKGAMGVVYHAYDPVVKRDVAIKLLSAIGSEETELISRFEREARLAGGLRHPNIVTIYDMGNYEGRPYIAMEYLLGRDLQQIIRQKVELTFEQRVEVVLQIAKGLDAAHTKGIIHRDIKPANIRLQDDNTVKIMDFGIARMGTSELTRSGYIIGTLQYMSPEQISGDQLDPRTDIFSTGVMAYELFTYSNPFNGEHTVDIMYRILNVRPQPIQNLPEETGTELNQIIMRALEKNRDLRYPSAKELSADLEEYLFYLKSLKFRRKSATPLPIYQEGVTQTLPLDQMPSKPALDKEIPATMATDVQNMPTFNMPSPSSQPGPAPSFGVPPPPPSEKVPRTGIGANYSETAQVLMHKPSVWAEKKFYILGVVMALLFVGTLLYFGTLGKGSETLAIITNPVGAEVLVNGQKIGVTPTSIQERKDIDLTFRLPGYKEQVVPVKKNAWPTELNITLEPVGSAPVAGKTDITPVSPSKKIIQVASNPPGASIQLDGQSIGQTPKEITLDNEQPHQLVLKMEGHEDVTRTLDTSTPGTLNIELPPAAAAPGFVKFGGPHRVAIISGSRALKGNPIELQPGTYKLTFRSSKDAYIRFSKSVEIKSGETVVVPAPAMGKITIKAVPSNCKILINGEFIDVAPVLNLPIQSGNHTITFSWDTLNKKSSKTVTVEGGQSQTVTGVPEKDA